MSEQQLTFLLGATIGAVIGFYLAYERFLRAEKPPVELVITPDVAAQLSAKMVATWLEQNGLTWMPKGKEFSWDGRKVNE